METQANSKIQLWRFPALYHLELLSAQHTQHEFPRHFHDTYSIALVERGAMGFYYRGANLTLVPTEFDVIHPGEVHSGHAATAEGWDYRCFYPAPALLADIASELTGKTTSAPVFPATVHDLQMRAALQSLHVSLTTPIPTLEAETRFYSVFAQLVQHYALRNTTIKAVGRERKTVQRILDLLHHSESQAVSLQELAHAVNWHPVYLGRVFRKEMGVPPFVYQRQLRLQHARQLIHQGHSLAQAAVTAGFADQSHLTRQFKQVYGFTPGLISRG